MEFEISDEVINLRDLSLNKKREYEDFIQFINEKIVANVINKYLEYIFKNHNIDVNFDSKDYTSLYLLIHFPNIMGANDKLKKLSKNILIIFVDLENNNKVITKDFAELLEMYKKIFLDLVEKNKQGLINTYAELYINLDEIEENIMRECEKKEIQESKNEYYKLLQEIVLDENKVNDIIKSKKDELRGKDSIYSVIKKEYWINIKKNIKEENYDVILDMLNEILMIFKSFISNNKDVLQEIEEDLNIKYITYIIKEKTFNKNDIINIFYSLVRTLKKLQCPIDDENLELWITNIENDINNYNIPIYEIVGDFFEEFYDRLIKLKNKILELII